MSSTSTTRRSETARPAEPVPNGTRIGAMYSSGKPTQALGTSAEAPGTVVQTAARSVCRSPATAPASCSSSGWTRVRSLAVGASSASGVAPAVAAAPARVRANGRRRAGG